jgi:O-Antigen ligase
MPASETTRIAALPRFEHRGRPRFFPQRGRPVAQRSYLVATWLVLIGIFLPPIQIPIAGLNFTPGRLVVFLLVIPALRVLLKGGRKSVASDYFAVATALWMLVSSIVNGGFKPYVGAEALEFLNAYLVGRAFFFGPEGLRTFMRVFKSIVPVLVILGLFDTLTERPLSLQLFGLADSSTGLTQRMGLARAASTFEGGEQFGTFCAAAGALFLYAERRVRRMLYVSLSAVGCFLSLSSGPWLGFAIATILAWYDHAMKRYTYRWKLISLVFFGVYIAASFVSKSPLGWMITHLTFNPQGGYFRLDMWNLGVAQIANAPWVGRGLNDFTGYATNIRFFLGNSVDAIWLLETMRYGIPMTTFLLLAIFVPMVRARKIPPEDPYMQDMRMAFSLAIITMCLIGLTVHLWNANWIFLSLCIGIRASFEEAGARRLGASNGVRVTRYRSRH